MSSTEQETFVTFNSEPLDDKWDKHVAKQGNELETCLTIRNDILNLKM